MKDQLVVVGWLMQWFPDGNIYGSFSLIVPDTDVNPGLGQDPRQLPLAHGGGDVEGRVSVLVLSGHSTLGADQDPRHPRVSVPGRRVERSISVLQIFFVKETLNIFSCNSHYF